jgi:ABC1 atypical kinase-like domain
MVGRIPGAASVANPPVLVDVFAETILEELDFRVEAANMLDIARVMVELDQRHWVVARPHPELVTRRMLVMERPSGFAFDDVIGMNAAGVDTEAVSSAPPPTTCAPSSPLCATSVPSTPTSISTGSSRTSTWTAPRRTSRR